MMQGLNTRGGTVTNGLNPRWDTFFDVVITTFPIPLVGDWFVRQDKNSPFIGPLSFRDADRQARFLSAKDPGVAQVVTIMGNRAGDPVSFPARVFVDGFYARGKKFLGGRAAQFHSDRELIKSAADFGMRLYGFRPPKP